MKKIWLLILVFGSVFLVSCANSDETKEDDKKEEEKDTVKPTIKINGGTVALIVGDSFEAPTVTVTDNVDQDLTVVISGDTVDTTKAGVYTLYYDATDKAGNKAVQKSFTVTVYVYDANMEIQNGGFETGDLTGWTVLEINASSDAFKNEFVVKTENRKEGTYFFDGSRTDDDKVGQIRSSNFKLGGSGWINFRLGGGNYIESLYLGVYKVSDDSLIAKFSNSNPQKYGGNETLVGYKFNLLTIDGVNLGDEFYIKVVDTQLSDWGIIKIDDIKTFNIIEPNHIIYELVSNQK